WWTLTATSAVAARTWARARSRRGTFATGHSAFGRSEVSGRSRVPAPAASTTAARLSAMETRRWVNPTQPQTMQIAVFLLYFTAALALVFGSNAYVSVTFRSLDSLVNLVLVAGGVAAGYGIANERKWGYGLGVVVAAIPLIARVYVGLRYQVSPLEADFLGLMFEV